MRSYKWLYMLLGISIGINIACHMTIAHASLNSITAKVLDNMQYKVDGEKKEIPVKYHSLSYQGRIYAPVRFIVESLGGELEWEKNTDTMLLKKPEPQIFQVPVKVEVPKEEDKVSIMEKNIKKHEEKVTKIKQQEENIHKNIIKEEKEEKQPKEQYYMLPYQYSNDKFNLKVNTVIFDSNITKMFIYLKNKTDTNLQLDQYKIVAKIGQNEYKTQDVDFAEYDERWYNDIESGEYEEGYVVLPKINKEENKNANIKFSLFENDGTGDTYEVSLNIQWTK